MGPWEEYKGVTLRPCSSPLPRDLLRCVPSPIMTRTADRHSRAYHPVVRGPGDPWILVKDEEVGWGLQALCVPCFWGVAEMGP